MTIKNDFHGTVCTLRTDDSGRLSSGQIRRCRKALCGIDGCTCGGELSERGPQDVEIQVVGWDKNGIEIALRDLDPSYR